MTLFSTTGTGGWYVLRPSAVSVCCAGWSRAAGLTRVAGAPLRAPSGGGLCEPGALQGFCRKRWVTAGTKRRCEIRGSRRLVCPVPKSFRTRRPPRVMAPAEDRPAGGHLRGSDRCSCRTWTVLGLSHGSAAPMQTASHAAAQDNFWPVSESRLPMSLFRIEQARGQWGTVGGIRHRQHLEWRSLAQQKCAKSCHGI